MRRRSRVVLAVGVVAVLFFVAAPVVYWYTVYFPGFVYPNLQPPLYSFYRSLSCVSFGFGVTYQTGGWHGLQGTWYLTCRQSVPYPL